MFYYVTDLYLLSIMLYFICASINFNTINFNYVNLLINILKYKILFKYNHFNKLYIL